jgi:hypothetical protein
MAELKTQPTDESVEAFLNAIPDETRRKDCFTLLGMMQQATGAPPVMWGEAIVGFGDYHYSYASGRQGDWFQVGFSPRKQNLTLYLMTGFDQYESLLAGLGKHSTSKSCLYIKRLSDIDMPTLQQLIRLSVEHIAGGVSG